MSKSVAASANDENLWNEVLQSQFDVVGQNGGQKAIVKRLSMGASDGWEGICLDKYTAHWNPYPLIIEGAEVVTDPTGRNSRKPPVKLNIWIDDSADY